MGGGPKFFCDSNAHRTFGHLNMLVLHFGRVMYAGAHLNHLRDDQLLKVLGRSRPHRRIYKYTDIDEEDDNK